MNPAGRTKASVGPEGRTERNRSRPGPFLVILRGFRDDGPTVRSKRAPSKSVQRTRTDIAALIEQDDLTIVFQPILDLRSGEVIGYEALTRPAADTPFAGPGELFEAAERVEMIAELERALRRLTFTAASLHWVEGTRLFLNVSPTAVLEDGFTECLCRELERGSRLDPRQLVIEITERADDELIDDIRLRMQELRKQGFQVAIDDVGAGSSGLNRIATARPDWLKLDIELITNIEDDPFKQNLIRFFVQFARLSNMHLIAEGVEREQELATLIRLGVSHAQGFHLARPGRLGVQLPREIRDQIIDLCRDAESRRFNDITTVRIGSLTVPSPTCDQLSTVDEAYHLLESRLSPSGIVVLDGLRYLGWISRDRLQTIVTETRGRIPLSAAKLDGCEHIGADVTLAEALHIVGSRSDERLTLPLVVESDGRVAGIVTLRLLLLAAAEAHRHATADVAPLAGLPGHIEADRWLTDRIGSRDPAHLAFVDIRDFDAYNRAYGFEMGDLMLRRLVGLIQEQFLDVQPDVKFIAHLGEDRFMFAFPSEGGDRLEGLVEGFEALRWEFFSAADQRAVTFSYVDARGQSNSVPLTTLRVAYLRNVLQTVSDSREIYELATQLRMRRPDQESSGGAVVTDRRAHRLSQRARA